MADSDEVAFDMTRTTSRGNRSSSGSRPGVRITTDMPLAQQLNTISAGFIKAAQTSEQQIPTTWKERIESGLNRCLSSSVLSGVMGFMILTDIGLGCNEIDNRAMGKSGHPALSFLRDAIFVMYVVELLLILVARGFRSIRNPWVTLDVIIVAGGLFDKLAQALTLDDGGVLLLARFLRIFRILRLTRVFGKFSFLGELQKLVKMALSCVKTLFWSLVFTFLVTTFWAMMCVELLRPYLLEIAEEGELDGCAQCVSSLDSVMHANLLLFKTVVAGDSWGQVAVPILLRHPWTAVVFIGSHMTIIFGALNLVVAVVVDEFAESRARDYEHMAEELENDHGKDTAFLTRIFKEIDADNSGEVELEELLDGARKVPEFRDRLRVLDIDESDLKQLFKMLDNDNSGTISSSEFINALSRWMHDSKTAARFTKYNLMKNLEETADLRFAVMNKLDRLEQRFQDRLESVENLASTIATMDASFERFESLARFPTTAREEEVGPLAPRPQTFAPLAPPAECRAYQGDTEASSRAAEAVQRCLQRAWQQIKEEMLLEDAAAAEYALRQATEAIRSAMARAPVTVAAAAAAEFSSRAMQEMSEVASSETASEQSVTVGGVMAKHKVQSTIPAGKDNEFGEIVDSCHPETHDPCIEACEEAHVQSHIRSNSIRSSKSFSV
eukprot:TRINITY_DN24466_c0_g1_i1.p1 TRINITY_DN24466_c0_g1~~TRINITY_DN24466_c0_g1_i1.p1  ORF type:complete len:681 (-),score=130.84 TRINITY_DN24466_c0_g1_i1:142-2151(-)